MTTQVIRTHRCFLGPFLRLIQSSKSSARYRSSWGKYLAQLVRHLVAGFELAARWRWKSAVKGCRKHSGFRRDTAQRVWWQRTFIEAGVQHYLTKRQIQIALMPWLRSNALDRGQLVWSPRVAFTATAPSIGRTPGTKQG